MTVQIYSRKAMRCALGSTGIEPGSVVLIHTALYAPGRIADTPLVEISSRFYAELRRIVGRQGTLVVPTFHLAFRRGETFDRQFTPATGMGSFAEYLRLLPGARRSPHAIHSLSAEGPLAEAITERDTPSAFGRGSPFDALIDLDAHLLTFGCTVETTCLVRWAEERVGVPYRRWMICRGRYIDDDKERMRSFHTYAGAEGREPNLCLGPIHRNLWESGRLTRAELGASVVESCRVRDFVTCASEILRRDPTGLLVRRSPGDSDAPRPGQGRRQ